MDTTRQGRRLIAILVLGAVWLGWRSSQMEVLFADGLRYISQAKEVEKGNWAAGLVRSIDHPIYPLAIAGMHQLIGGSGPDSWQTAGQVATVLAAVLAMVPLYLITAELQGGRGAWLACVLALGVPTTCRVFSDVLSESTFLLWWLWGVWSAMRFLREGRLGWLPLTLSFAALAYLTRPEGALLPAVLVLCLLLMPLSRATRMNWPRWWLAIGSLVVGGVCVIGPYAAMKGGLGTKPAIARLLGTSAGAPAQAVERERPLDVDATWLSLHAQGFREVGRSLRDAVSIPVIPLALIGIVVGLRRGRPRAQLLASLIVVVTILALVRLYATAGYCDPRHTLVVTMLAFSAAGFGLSTLISRLTIPARWLGLEEGRMQAGPAVWALVVLALLAWNGRQLMQPNNDAFVGYRQAADWLASNDGLDRPVLDLTGWTLFYGGLRGYTFRTLGEGVADPSVRFLVAREAHLRGPWFYCDAMRERVDGRLPVARFPQTAAPGQARVLVFDLQAEPYQSPDVAGADDPLKTKR